MASYTIVLYILALLRIIQCTQRGLENKLLDVVVTTKLKLAAVAMKSKKLDARKRGDKKKMLYKRMVSMKHMV